jgi:Ras-related protein Rab-8A
MAMISQPTDSGTNNQGVVFNSYKVLLLGNSYVGKTCILLRFSEDIFKENYDVTIGLNYRIKSMTVENKPIKMQIWDTSGEEKFKAIAKNFYRGAHGVLLVYDICQKNSFLDVKSWIEQIIENADNDDIVMILCGNKCDNEKERKISREEGENLAKNYGIPFFECSAKNNININKMFETMAQKIFTKVGNRQSSSVKLTPNSIKKKIGKCCISK